MCGRYAAAKSTDELVEEFEVEANRTEEPTASLLKSPQQPPAGQPDYNIAPTKAARVVLSRPLRADPPRGGPDGPPVRQLRLLTWGLVPSWAPTPSIGVRMINARAEEAMTKRAFAAAVRSRRCLVPASGWYEWHPGADGDGGRGKSAGRGRARQPYFLSRLDDASCALAGLYEFWRDPARPPEDPAAWLTSFAIVTTAAEPDLAGIHDRQPLVLERGDWLDWLAGDTSAARVEQLLRYEEPGRFVARPVGPAVGNSRATGPELIAPMPNPAADVPGGRG